MKVWVGKIIIIIIFFLSFSKSHISIKYHVICFIFPFNLFKSGFVFLSFFLFYYFIFYFNLFFLNLFFLIPFFFIVFRLVKWRGIPFWFIYWLPHSFFFLSVVETTIQKSNPKKSTSNQNKHFLFSK